MTEFYTHCGTERYFDFDDKVCDEETGKALTVKEIVTVLNELNNQADAVREELRLCEEENNALQERNDRQFEMLKELYTMIENKDWTGLTAHMEELYKCEEQLQREWRTYSG